MLEGLTEYWEIDTWDEDEKGWMTECEMPNRQSALDAMDEYKDRFSGVRVVHVKRSVSKTWRAQKSAAGHSGGE